MNFEQGIVQKGWPRNTKLTTGSLPNSLKATGSKTKTKPSPYLSFLFFPPFWCFPAKLLKSSSVGCWYQRRLTHAKQYKEGKEKSTNVK